MNVLLALVGAFAITSHATDLAPDRAALCSALFLERPATPPVQGSLRYHLNTMNYEIFSHLENLDNKVLTSSEKARRFLWSMRPSRVVEGLIESRSGKKDATAASDAPIRAVFRNLSANAWSAQTEPTIAAIVGRLRQLDQDFSSARGTDLAFGYELRGRASIAAYLDRVAAHGRALDAAVNPVVDEAHPYFEKFRVLRRVSAVGLVAAYADLILWPIARDIPTADAFGQITAVGLLAYVAPVLYTSLRKSADYALGGVSDAARVKFENEFASHRAREAVGMLDEMRKMAGEAPSADSFVFNSVDTTIPRSFATALSDAQNVGSDAAPADLAAAILRRRRGFFASVKEEAIVADAQDPVVKLLTDQCLFFDRDTGEPVLVSFLRIKRPTAPPPRRRKKVKEAPRPIFAPEGALGTAG